MANKKEDYLFISAMLSARAGRLLTNEKAERMLDAPGFEDAARMLTDAGYPDMSAMTASEVEQTLAKYRDSIFAELGKFSPDKTLVDVFKLKYDYHNAKVIIKSEAMGTDAKRLLSDSGRIPGAKLMELYNEEKRVQMPEKLAGAMWEAKSVLARTANPQLSDFILDRAYFAELKSAADKLESSFLKGYAEILIDSANMKSSVRSLRMGKNQDFLTDVLIPGGSVSVQRLSNVSDKDALAALFANGILDKASRLGGDAIEGGSMTAFELACDNAVCAYLKGARLISYGCEGVIAYMAAIESEITAIRMILTGRLTGVAPEIIRERLRDLYA